MGPDFSGPERDPETDPGCASPVPGEQPVGQQRLRNACGVCGKDGTLHGAAHAGSERAWALGLFLRLRVPAELRRAAPISEGLNEEPVDPKWDPFRAQGPCDSICTHSWQWPEGHGELQGVVAAPVGAIS